MVEASEPLIVLLAGMLNALDFFLKLLARDVYSIHTCTGS